MNESEKQRLLLLVNENIAILESEAAKANDHFRRTGEILPQSQKAKEAEASNKKIKEQLDNE